MLTFIKPFIYNQQTVMKTKLAIIIPCYNEANRLNIQEFNDFLSQNPTITFIFANDGSQDDTLKVLENICAINANASLLDFKENAGKAETVRKSLKAAQEKITCEYYGYFDADCATPLYEILNVTNLTQQNRYKMILCSRIKRLGANVERKFSRHLLGRSFATFASLVLKLPVYDTQCGAKILHHSTIESVTSEKFISKWLFDIEVIFRVLKCPSQANEFYEYPLSKWHDIAGSKLKIMDFIKAPLELLKIWVKYR